MKPDRVIEKLWDLEPEDPALSSSSGAGKPCDPERVTTPQNLCSLSVIWR